MLALGVLAVTVAGKAAVQVKPGYEEPLNLFTVVVLPPGNRKSTVFADMVRPVQEFEAEERERLGPAIAQSKTAYRIRKAEVHKAEQEAASAETDDREQRQRRAMELAQELYGMPEPALPRFICDDCTPERIASLLYEQGGRIGVFSPEGDVFEILSGRYTKNGAPNFATFTKGHAGDAIYVDRVGREGLQVPKPALTVALAVQPDVIRQLTRKPGFRGRGLLGRFLYAMPESPLGRRETRPTPVLEPVRDEYRSGMRALLQLWPSSDSAGKRVRTMLAPQPEADARLEEFEQAVEARLGLGGELHSMTDWGGKLFGAVARMAGLLHLAKYAALPDQWTDRIGMDSVEGAIRLGEYGIPHAQAAFAEMGAEPAIDDAHRVLEWIVTSAVEEFSVRGAFEGTKGHFKRVEKLKQALDVLEEHEYIRALPASPHEGPGRLPSPRFQVNPHVASQYSRYSQNR